jgi:hypothetical protein
VRSQTRQHEADQCDGVFRLLETHLEDQPRPQPTDQRLSWLVRLFSLRLKISAASASQASTYYPKMVFNTIQ